MHQKRHLALTRETLYELAWAKPMTQIAKDYEISDRAMAKLCARKQVPVPPRGYWAKKFASRSVAKPPLPALITTPPKEKDVTQKEQVKADRKDAPVGRRKKIHSIFEDRDRETKQKLKELRKMLSEELLYTVRVKSWNADYSFGLNSNYNPLRKYDDVSFLYKQPYDEYRALFIKGDVVEPSQLKGQKVEIHFFPRPDLNKKYIKENLRHYEDSPPRAIGSIRKNDHNIMALISMPDDALNLLLQNAAANKVNFITFHGEKLRFGHGHVFRFSFREKHDEEEFFD